MFKKAFGQAKKMQKKVILLSNIFSNKFDDLVTSFDKEDIIYCHQTKNATSL